MLSGTLAVIVWDLVPSQYWYHLTVQAGGAKWRCAGHVGIGCESLSDLAAKIPMIA
jgi:hypothetical protein